MSLGLLVAIIAIALVFTYINGFHDTANSIATVVATKVLSPGQAVLLAATTNLAGALLGSADRKSTRLNSSHPSTSYAVSCAKKKTSICATSAACLSSAPTCC